MNTRSEPLFVPELRRLGQRLLMPIPDRVRILRELSADLESLTDRLIADGVAPDEARRRATETLVPDGHTLEALHRLHEPLYVRLTRRVDPSRLRTIEGWALVIVTGFMVVMSVAVLARAEMVWAASAFQWPVMAAGIAMILATLAKSFEIWVKKDHSSLRRGLGGVLVLCATPLLLAAVGLFTDLYRAASIVEASPERLARVAGEWLFADALLLATGLICTLTGALAWFVMTHWITHLEAQQREVLGLTGPDSPKGD